MPQLRETRSASRERRLQPGSGAMDEDDTEVMVAQVCDLDDTPPFGGMFDDTDVVLVTLRPTTVNDWPPAPRAPASAPAPARRRAAIYRAVKRPDTAS